ncbi:MAG: hypothetical protein WCC87_04440 [Candidatus Korobacteraceae bacterium]
MKLLNTGSKIWFAAYMLAAGALLFAQAGPPPGPLPNVGSYSSVSGAISQLNYGPEMEVTSFLVNRNTLVTFAPHVGAALGSVLKPGQNVQVSGDGSPTVTGMQRIELVTLNAGGKTFTVPQPGQFTSYNGSGRVIQLNYNREGDVDGFLLDNGVFAKTPPPFSATLTSKVAVGSQVSLTGYSHPTISGRTVVDVQSINGQALAYAPPGPPPPPR